MARRTIDFTASPSDFVVNHKRGSDYSVSVQNNTGAVLTPTYTNQNIQEASPAFSVGDGTDLPTTIASGALVCFICPVEAIRFTGTPGGTIDIVEAG
jgi:hypothetical protein